MEVHYSNGQKDVYKRQEGGIVELIDVDVVGFQRAETGLQILPEALRRLRAGLRRQHDLVCLLYTSRCV